MRVAVICLILLVPAIFAREGFLKAAEKKENTKAMIFAQLEEMDKVEFGKKNSRHHRPPNQEQLPHVRHRKNVS